jgi:23S rRNA pseudouridine2605 synthase
VVSVQGYLIKTEEEVMQTHLEKISKGTKIRRVFVKPIKVTKMQRGTLKIVENAGLSIFSLDRIPIGSLMLGDLPIRAFRPLTEKEKSLLVEAR